MTTAAPLESRDSIRLYRALMARNRRVGLLRVLVPVVGLVLLAIPLVSAMISSLGVEFSVEGVRLESDTLVVDAPRFEGTLAGGEAYTMVAERAESQVGDLDTVELYDLDLDLAGHGDYRAQVHIARGAWTLSSERLVSNEDVAVSDSTGARGILAGVEVDWPGQIVTSEGPVRFEFDNDSQLQAQEMRYAIEDAHWHFTRVRLGMVPTADSGTQRSIEDYIEPGGEPDSQAEAQ